MADFAPVKEPFPINYSVAVQCALSERKPIIALESTVITHGLPYPRNVETALRLESIARSMGVEPVTIIVLDGRIHLGLDDNLAERLHPEKAGVVLHKLSLRDLPWAVVTKASGGTTVSATMAIAQYACIKVFATGGIGGVHRGWNLNPDISTDLTALSRIPIIVVSAGCKAILDISATLEALETLGVPVYGWQTDFFPAFYTRQTDHPIPRFDTAEQIATAFRCHGAQYLHSQWLMPGMLIANPIPPQHDIPATVIEPLIQSALKEAQRQGIAGKAITPFLLSFLAQNSQGGSVEANQALLENNVRLGCEIALRINKGET